MFEAADQPGHHQIVVKLPRADPDSGFRGAGESPLVLGSNNSDPFQVPNFERPLRGLAELLGIETLPEGAGEVAGAGGRSRLR